MRLFHFFHRVPITIALILSAAACSDTSGPESPPRLTLSVASAASNGAQAPGLARAVTQEDGANRLVLSRVAIVLREVELKRAAAGDCDSAGEGEHSCEEFEVGPFLLELALDGSVDQVMAIDVPPDTYDGIEFDIHKPEDNSQDDSSFLRAHPDFKGVSIRVEGTWNDEPFVFVQDLNEEQEIELSPALVVGDAATPSNVTLTLDLAGWFRDSQGILLDPRTANKGGANQNLVENNIRRSIEAFEDGDEDGRRDG